MARYTDSVCKLCRREGEKLFLKGERCFTPKCAFERRSYGPGMHGRQSQFRRKESDYALQLRAKQKARRVYGIYERQFRRYFREAQRQKGLTGLNLLIMLESRLDNVVYRLGGSVCYDGQKHLIEHPRLRGKDNKEVPLKSYKSFQNPQGMRDLVSRRMVLGLSSRNYEEAVEGFLKGYGITKSSVSRHFIKATAQQMREFLERDLSTLGLCSIFIDGIQFKGHLLIVALGPDVTGRNHILGLREGATENSEVCMGLLEDMARRGLPSDKDYLFVLDGAKALRAAVTRMYGSKVAVQRCQQHKRRNVCDHLPVEHQEAIDARIRAAYNMKTYEEAKQSLELTVKYLEHLNPSAASRLK